MQLSPVAAQSSGVGEPPLSISAFGALQRVDLLAAIAPGFFAVQCTNSPPLLEVCDGHPADKGWACWRMDLLRHVEYVER